MLSAVLEMGTRGIVKARDYLFEEVSCPLQNWLKVSRFGCQAKGTATIYMQRKAAKMAKEKGIIFHSRLLSLVCYIRYSDNEKTLGLHRKISS